MGIILVPPKNSVYCYQTELYGCFRNQIILTYKNDNFSVSIHHRAKRWNSGLNYSTPQLPSKRSCSRLWYMWVSSLEFIWNSYLEGLCSCNQGKIRSFQIEKGPKCNDQCFSKKKERENQIKKHRRYTGRKSYIEMEAEITVMCL